MVHQRRCLVNGDADELKLRVILDRFSAEIFINDGEQVMSAVIFTEQEAKEISFFAEGAIKIDVVALGELLIDFTENGKSNQGNPPFFGMSVIE